MVDLKHLSIVSLVLLLLLTVSGCGGGSGGGSGSGNNVGQTNPPATGSLTLTWDPTTEYNDGTPLTPDGYKVYYGTIPGIYTESVNVGNYTVKEITNLASGKWCFVVTAYDDAGIESNYSDMACGTI